MPRIRKFSVIHNPDTITRPIDFGGLSYAYTSRNGKTGYIYPTDIDAFLDIRGKAFVVIEVKEEGAIWPTGQSIAFKRLASALMQVRPTLAIRATHSPDANPIDLATCRVFSYLEEGSFYRGAKWVQHVGDSAPTVRELVDTYMTDVWKIDLTQ